MGNQQAPSLKMVPATEQFKLGFWKYTWYPVETLKIYRVAEIRQENRHELFDGALVYGSRYSRKERTVYSTAVMPDDNRNIKKLVMAYSIRNLIKFVDRIQISVEKMSEDGLYAEIKITTNDPADNKNHEKTAIFKRWSLFF